MLNAAIPTHILLSVGIIKEPPPDDKSLTEAVLLLPPAPPAPPELPDPPEPALKLVWKSVVAFARSLIACNSSSNFASILFINFIISNESVFTEVAFVTELFIIFVHLEFKPSSSSLIVTVGEAISISLFQFNII